METRTTYICEYCGKEFSTEEECLACEETHKEVSEMTPVWDVVSMDETLDATPVRDESGNDYPAAIVCTFENDRHVLYLASKFVEDMRDAVSHTFTVERQP